MKTLSISEAARSFTDALDELERDQEEVAFVRGQRQIARLVPEPQCADALAVFGDLYATLDNATGKALQKAVTKVRKNKNPNLAALRNPWVS